MRGGVSSSYSYTNFAKRSEDTRLHLHTAYASNGPSRFILLSATAQNCIGWEAPQVIYFATDYISPTNVTLLGETLNADGQTFRKLDRNSTYDATPTVSGATNYQFNVNIATHRQVDLSRSYHHLFEVRPFTVPIPQLGTIQQHFNSASEGLARDDDAKILDATVTESTNASSVWRTDDMPAYVEFRLSNGPLLTNVITRAKNRPVFPPNFRSTNYFRVRTDPAVSALLGWTGANIKLVKTLMYGGIVRDGIGNRPSSPATMIMVHSLPGVVGVHEWAHTLGLTHRGEGVNYGPTTHVLMSPTNYPNAYKINRYERGFIQ